MDSKLDLIQGFGTHGKDTGSSPVQVALLTKRINEITTHLVANRKDHHTRRGLLKLVGRRRRLLAYYSRENPEEYQQLINRLGLRR